MNNIIRPLFFIWLMQLFIPLIIIENFFSISTIGLLFLLLLYRIKKNSIVFSRNNIFYILFIFYILLQYTIIDFDNDKSFYFYYLQRYLEAGIIFFIVSNILTINDIEYYVKLICCFVFIAFFIGLLQYFLGYGREYLAFYSIGDYEYMRRPIINGVDPNYYFLHLILPLCFSLHKLIDHSLNKNRAILLLGLVVFSINVFLLASKSALIITMLLYLYYFMKPSRKQLIYSSLLIVFFMFIFPFLSELAPYTIFRMQSLFSDDWSIISTHRTLLWAKSFNIFLNNPIFGSGLGQIVAEYSTSSSLLSIGGGTTHNSFIHSLGELGIIGTCLISIFIFHHIKKSFIENSFFFPVIVFSCLMLCTIDALWYKQFYVYLSLAYIYINNKKII